MQDMLVLSNPGVSLIDCACIENVWNVVGSWLLWIDFKAFDKYTCTTVNMDLQRQA